MCQDLPFLYSSLVCLPGLSTHGHRSLARITIRKYVFVEKSESIMEGRMPVLPLGSAPGGCWASLWPHLRHGVRTGFVSGAAMGTRWLGQEYECPGAAETRD